jgi:type IV pilus assembly protein PilB
MTLAAKQSLDLGRSLGDILIDMGLLKRETLDLYLQSSIDRKGRLGRLLVQDGKISESDLARALAAQHQTDFLDLESFTLDPAALRILPEKVVRMHSILPVEIIDRRLVLAMSDPIEAIHVDRILKAKGIPYRIAIAPLSAIQAVIERAYGSRTSIDHVVKDLVRNGVEEKTQTISIEPLVDSIITRGVRDHASDIHIDPAEKLVRIRVRIDGILHTLSTYPHELHGNVISRLKVLGRMDISEKRAPQDGRFHHVSEGKAVDIRISTLPTIYGEKAVMRIIDKSTLKGTFAELGMDAEIAKQMSSLLATPHGILFVTGPTGSGKTTTLYSMLNQVNDAEKNIISVEDPVEYRFDLINQVQVHEKSGLSFAGLLKNILRQDPDVLMIGEVRDKETADIAFQAALTGHLVLSTLHTNDAISTPTRLMDIGIEPFLISSALIGMLSQRLVRVLCPHCKQKTVLTAHDVALLGRDWVSPGIEIYAKKGCEKCYNTGYSGRTSLFEFLIPDKTIQKMISQRGQEGELLAYAKSIGFRTMRQDGISKILAGVTSIEEVVKTTI